MLIGVMVSFLGAIVGMISLWTAMASTEALAGRRTLCVALLIGIAVGIADAFYWLWTIGHEHGTQWSAWLLMLIAAIILGARYARRLEGLRNE
jgi:hypothetical protein